MNITGQNIIKAVLTVVSFFIGGVLMRLVIVRYISGWAKKTKNKVDDVLLKEASLAVFWWAVLAGIYISAQFILTGKALIYSNKAIIVLFILSFCVFSIKVLNGFLQAYSARLKETIAFAGLTQSISKVIIFTLGFLVILNTLGVSITPLLTTLGIGGLAVALALQDTLANFFSGIYIVLSKQIRIGDYIKLDSGQEGYVTDINWRMTKIKMIHNNIVLVPNSKLAQAIVTNFYMPKKEMSVIIQVGVHYNSDLEKVEAVTLSVAKEVLEKCQGAVTAFEPFIRYHTFGSSSINFSVILRAKEFIDQYRLKHDFVKALHRRYKEENIVIPFPIVALNTLQEKR